MFDMNTALNIHRIKCEEVIKDSDVASTSDEIDAAYADWCEAEGMIMMLTQACGKCLRAINSAAEELHNNAWAAWNAASNRINYDPITGNPRRA